ncbi:MAG TPA: pre-16S rRNA-processing nuclease YqgF [bacterium]
MSGADPVILAVDPGREKCGMAVLDGGRVVARGVLPIDQMAATALRWARDFGAHTIVLGNRTGAADAKARLEAAVSAVPVVLVDEAGTTEVARRRYFAEHPPRGWRRLIPVGMQTPPDPYDDYVAVLLAERFLSDVGKLAGTSQNGNVRPFR